MTPELLAQMDAWWRAANYLSVGQIYLLDNPLLREPLRLDHIKPRLLGHWGTTPGLNFVYVHLNRIIVERDLDVIYVIGPGHGGPGIVANGWLEGTYSEVYPDISQDADGMKGLFHQFSFPGGIPSHVAPETPGSIHEGGELGYSLSHAFGAAFDNPGLVVACVVGDGEAETGPLATSWHSNKFLNPVHDGAPGARRRSAGDPRLALAGRMRPAAGGARGEVTADRAARPSPPARSPSSGGGWPTRRAAGWQASGARRLGRPLVLRHDGVGVVELDQAPARPISSFSAETKKT